MASLVPVILVLEQQRNRIEWLEKAIDCPVNIQIVVDLPQLAEVQEALDVSLVVVGYDVDPTLLTTPAPVLVWTTDPDDADKMALSLKEKGTPCVLTPFYPHNLAAIKQLLISTMY